MVVAPPPVVVVPPPVVVVPPPVVVAPVVSPPRRPPAIVPVTSILCPTWGFRSTLESVVVSVRLVGIWPRCPPAAVVPAPPAVVVPPPVVVVPPVAVVPVVAALPI